MLKNYKLQLIVKDCKFTHKNKKQKRNVKHQNINNEN